ncbi:LysR family transcriptional regulator [Microbulbifer sp. TRSA007]|uniref:LysR family transcriptional regulator n=1 Tax=Microbulbifer sp. TRSA007 TaxID=3243384 RepID=UPI004039BED6
MRREYDKYHLINVFCSVVDHGSLSKAAKHLGLSTPTVSKTLAQLEQALGQVLLNRTTRAIAVTDAGRITYQKGQKIISSFTELEDQIAEAATLTRGKLKLTFPETLGLKVFSHICNDFQKAIPDFSLELIFSPYHLDLIEDDIDIAFRVWETLPDCQFYAQPLFSIRPIFIAAPTYLEEHGCPKSIAELSQHNIMLTRLDGLEDGWSIDGKFYQFNGNLISNKTFHTRAAALNGNGIAKLPSYFCQRDIKKGRLVEVLPDLERKDKTVGAIYKVKRKDSKKIDVFLNFAQERLQEYDFSLFDK